MKANPFFCRSFKIADSRIESIRKCPAVQWCIGDSWDLFLWFVMIFCFERDWEWVDKSSSMTIIRNDISEKTNRNVIEN
jgi:hypothetical protein